MEISKSKITGINYNSIDLFKFIMAFVVIAAHTNPLINFENPALLNMCNNFISLAVPFFFLSSGYLLAIKMDYPYGSHADLLRIKKQLFHILQMYLVWTVIYLPLAIYFFISNDASLVKSILSYIRGLVFRGENYNSWPLWYLLSTVYSLLVIQYVLRLKKSSKVLIAISIAASILSIGITAFANSTGNFIPIIDLLQTLIKYSIGNGRLFNGLIYIPIGMLLAHKKIPRTLTWIGLICGFTATCFADNDALKSAVVIITAISLFSIVEGIKLKNNSIYFDLRNMSTIMYLIHMYVWSFYYKIVYGEKTFGLDSFIVTAILCVIIGWGTIEVKKRLKRNSDKINFVN